MALDFSRFGTPVKQAPVLDFSKFGTPVEAEKEEPPSRTFGEAAGDVGASLVKGLGQAAQFPGQLVGLVPGMRGVGEALAAPGAALAEYGEGLKSAGLKAREALRNKALSEAEKEGFLAEFSTAIGQTIKDPALLSSFLLEQVPQLIGPAAAVKVTTMLGRKGVQAAAEGEARKAAETALRKRATAAAVGTGAAAQGSSIGDETYKAVYDLAIKQGKTEEEANALAAEKARVAALEAGAISVATSRLPGGSAIERRLAGLPGVPGAGRIGVGVREGFTEGLEEAGGAFAKGVGMAEVEPTISPVTGVGTAAGLGVIGGAGLGALVGGRPVSEEAPQPGAAGAPETPIERAAREAAEKAAAEAPTPPETPTPPADKIKEPTVRKPGELPQTLDDATIRSIGFSRGKIRDALLGKAITDPEIRTVLEEYKQRPNASAKTAAKIDAFLARLPEAAAPPAPPVAAPPAEPTVPEPAPPAPPPVVEAAAPAVPPAEAPVGGTPSPAPKQTAALKTGETIAIETQASPESFSSLVRLQFGEPKALIAKDKLGAEVGRLTYMPGGGPIDVFVREENRRRGVATALYDVFEAQGGKLPDIQSGVAISDEARALRASRDQKRTETPSVTTARTEPEAGGASPGVAGGPAAVTPAAGPGEAQPDGVVPAAPDVGQPAGGEEAAPAAVTPAPAPTPAAPAPKPAALPEYTEEDVDRAVNTGLLTEEQAEAYRAELREEEAPPTAMAAAFEKQVAALKAEQDKLRQKNGRAPAPKSKNRAKYDELQAQLDALAPKEEGDLIERLEKIGATGVVGTRGERPVIDLDALRENLIKARAAPRLQEAILTYIGVDKDGNYLPTTYSREEAAEMAGLGRSSGANVTRTAQALGITADVVSRFHAGQTDIIVRGKNVSEAGTGATDLQPTRGVLYEAPKKNQPGKAAGFLRDALTEKGTLDFTKLTDKQVADIYARASNYDPKRGGNEQVIRQLNEEIAARTKKDRKGMQSALDRAYRVVRAEEEAAAEQAETERVAEEGVEPEAAEAEDKTRRLSDEEADESQYQLRQKPAGGMPKERVEQVVAKVTEGWVNLPPIEVVQSETDLPAGIQKQIKRDGVSGQVPGLYNNGKVWLIADNNASAVEIFNTIAHEVTGHYGLRGVLGNKFKETMKRIYDSDAEIRMLATDKMKKQPKMPTETAVEEVLADMQEKDRARPLYKRIVGIIRTALQKIFKGSHYFSRDQVEDLLWQSRAWVRKARKPSKVATTDEALFRPGTSAFKRWFSDSKVVDEKGEPLVVYHGTVKDFSTFDATRAGQTTGHRTAGWGFFFSANPQVAEIFAGKQTKLVSKPEWTFTTPEGLDKLRVVFGLKPKNVRRVLTKEAEFEDTFSKGSNLMSIYLSIQNPKELFAEEFIERFVEGTENAQRFVEQAKKEGHDGIVIRAGQPGKYKFEGSEYAADAWVAFSPDQIKSATGNVGAYGQRPITEEEAQRFGMTQEEAAEAQAAGDIRFRVTPEAEKAAAEADVIGERKETTFREKVGRELKGNKALRLREKFTDSLAPLEDFFVNAYGGQVRTAGGRLNPMVLLSRALDALRVSKAAQEQGGLAKEDGLIVATELKNDKGESVSYKDVLKRITDTAKAEGKTYEEYLKTIDNVLYGHREYNLREKNKTAKPEDQITLLLDDKKIDALENAFQKDDFIKGISADLDTIRFNMLDMLVDTGRISQEQSQDYKDAIGYIPFERIGEYENAWSGATRGANRGVAALKRMRKLEGSDRKSTSVVENFSGLMDWATKEAMKNEAASRALDDMLLMGAAKRGEAPATDSPGGEVMVYKDGKPSKFYVPDPAHLVAFSIADPQLSKILRGLQSATQVLRAGVTSMPPFAIKQVFDDIVRAYTYAGVKNNKALVKEVLFNFPKNWANEVLRRKPAGVRELEALGIVGTFDFTQQKNLKNILEEAGAKKEGLGTRIIRVMEAGAKASDLAVRQAIYNQVLKETGDKAQAESAAREIINFSRRGSSKMMNQMISVIPFFNAYARGMDKLATAAAGKVVGKTTGTARSMFYSRMAVLTSMGLMYALMMQDDDEYNSLPDHVRDANWVLPFGKELGFVPVIPVPAELAFFFKAIPERVVRYYKYQGTDEERTAMELLGEMTKRGIDVFSSPNITPQAIRPLLENIVNYSFFLGRPLESQAQLKLRPFERYGVGTSDSMKVVAKKLENFANATGIDAFAVSPIKLENAVRGLLGTVGGLTLAVTDMRANPDRTDRPLHQQLMPQLTGASAVMKNPVGTKYMDEIYNLENKTEQVYGTYNRLLKGTDPEKADKFLEDNIGMYSIRPAVQAVMGAIRTLNQTAMTIDKDKSMSPEERRKVIDELRVEQNEIARQVYTLRKQALDIQLGM